MNVTLQLSRVAADPHAKFDWGELLVCSAVGGVAGLLPDLIEPADSPNHRGFFHSLTAAALLAYAITGKHTKELSAEALLLLGVVGCSYISHIAADATTPKSIRFI